MKKSIYHAFLVITAVLFIIAGLAISAPKTSEQALVGKWKLIEPAVDAQGQPCTFVSEGMEFFSDQTVILSTMPGNRISYKTTSSDDERSAVETRIPSLKGKPLLLMKPMPQMEWRNTPITYGYDLTEKGASLALTVPGWSPAKYQRVKQAECSA